MKIFISYQNDSINDVEYLVDFLEEKGNKCFYAKRDIGTGVYAEKIVEFVEWCDAFIVLLTDLSYVSPGVQSEIELVMDKLTRHIQTLVIPVKLTNNDLPPAYKYYLKPHNWVIGTNKKFYEVAEEILTKIDLSNEGIQNNFVPNIDSRLSLPKMNKNVNSYLSYMSNNPDEDYRLESENLALLPIENESYDKIFLGKENLNILDCHALHPRSAIKRLVRKETNKYIGLCYDKTIVENANLSLGNEFIKFYDLVVLDDDFNDRIHNIMIENQIEKFDIINITMGLMDSNKHYKYLKNVVSLLRPGGYIYIRDIDDIVTYGYPDEEGRIKKFIEIIKDDKFAGNRASARTIYSDLKLVHAKKISLEKSGISTATMSYEDKKRFFISYFTFAKREFEILLKQEPDNEIYKEHLDFIDEYIDDFERCFEDEKFIFNSGFFIYLAEF